MIFFKCMEIGVREVKPLVHVEPGLKSESVWHPSLCSSSLSSLLEAFRTVLNTLDPSVLRELWNQKVIGCPVPFPPLYA